MLCCVCSKRALSRPSQAADAPGATAPMSRSALVCPGLPRSDSPGFSVLDVETERAGGQVAVPVHLGHCECDEARPAPVRLGSNSEVISLHLPAAGHHTGPPYPALLASPTPISITCVKEVKRRPRVWIQECIVPGSGPDSQLHNCPVNPSQRRQLRLARSRTGHSRCWLGIHEETDESGGGIHLLSEHI